MGAGGVMLNVISILIALGALTAPARADHLLDGRDLAAGKSLYAAQCASCHGAELQGQPDWQSAGPDGVLPAPPHDDSGHTWHHETELLFDYVRFGGAKALAARGIPDFPSGMPGFEGTLDEGEIYDILAFIRSIWPRRAQEYQRARDPQHD